ncbi:hypothetical protein LX32DRAFT_711099, partial [Colletotrichum zoysiae]
HSYKNNHRLFSLGLLNYTFAFLFFIFIFIFIFSFYEHRLLAHSFVPKMRFGGLLLLAHSLVAAAASIQKPPVGQRDLERKPLKGTAYEVAKISGDPPTYMLFGKGHEGGESEMARITYRRTTLTRRPVLDIWAAPEMDARGQQMPLSTLIKGVTAEETKVRLDSVPYVVFSGYQLWEMVYHYASEEQQGRPKSFKLTPKDRRWWGVYRNTVAFKTVTEVFAPRKIKGIAVNAKKSGYETRFILQ